MMSPAYLGLSLGLAIGLLDFVVLEWMARKMVVKGIEHGASREEQRSIPRFIRTMGIMSLILFPIIGYVVGPHVFGTPVTRAGG